MKLFVDGPEGEIPAFETAAYALEIDAVSEPVQTQFGYHLIQRIDV